LAVRLTGRASVVLSTLAIGPVAPLSNRGCHGGASTRVHYEPAWYPQGTRGAYESTTRVDRKHFTATTYEIEGAVAAWPELPEAIKAGIVGMVKATKVVGS